MNLWTPRLTVFSVVLIAILLIALGMLQYRWVGELSEFERERMQESLEVASDRFRTDFTRELDRVWRPFRAERGDDVPAGVAAAYVEWIATFPFPELFDAVFWASADPGGPEISRFDPRHGRFDPAEWPPALGALRNELRRDLQSRRRGDRRGSYYTPLGDDTLALVVTQRATQSRAIVLLRRDVLIDRLIPARIQEYVAGGGELDYDVRIFDGAGDGPIVYDSGPTADTAVRASADVQIALRIPGHLDLRPRGDHNGQLFSVHLQHRAGSLEAAVAQIRRRNVLTSLGVLTLLGASVLVLIASTRRAQSLAAQQVEFVAGVSHELRTPITGISSLSQNLADGIVDNLAQARTYGDAIRRESGRLADMIERVLQFSAMRSGNRRRDMQAVALPAVIDDVLDTAGGALSDRFRFEKVVEQTLPQVQGDERALRSAIQNLISNAMKFSAAGAMIRLSARLIRIGERKEIQVAVEDGGRGIPPAERKQVFEPFYRGEAARTDQVEGSGLGLSLVRDIATAHGGRVTLAGNAAGGSTFTLHLPVTQAEAADAQGNG